VREVVDDGGTSYGEKEAAGTQGEGEEDSRGDGVVEEEAGRHNR
jgi:hypothetical protein